ncbi:MAG: hypothetical protein WCD76_07670, partial [Pyrinomonadaceae bacterium]
MSKLRMLFFAVVGILMASAPTFAQAANAAADNEFSVAKYAKIAAGFGFAIAAALAAIGQSRV